MFDSVRQVKIIFPTKTTGKQFQRQRYLPSLGSWRRVLTSSTKNDGSGGGEVMILSWCEYAFHRAVRNGRALTSVTVAPTAGDRR